MAEQDKGTVRDTENQTGEGGEGEGEPYIPGTSFKSKEDAAKGYQELRQFADRQGTEVGQLRQQLQETQRAIEQMQSKQAESSKAAPKTDYDAELDKIYEQMEELGKDPYDEGNAKQISSLNRKAVQLARAAAKEEAMSEASGFLKKELEERDQQQAYQQFYDQNPEFQDPQMQQQIKGYIAKDKTGMSDPLVAFREIQRDQAQARVAELEKELAEKSKLLELKEGTAQTGKVMTKGQGASETAKTKQPKLSGADLDAAMLDAVRGG